MAQNNEFTSYLAAQVYVAPAPASIPAYTQGSNDDAIAAYLESACVFTRLWGVTGLKITKDYSANKASIKGDECDYVESKYSRPDIKVDFNLIENVNPD